MADYSDQLKEALWFSSSKALSEELTDDANAFSDALREIAVMADAEISQVIRKGVLDVFGGILKRSPVDTGAYRASHGIANFDPGANLGIVKGKKGQTIPESVALSKAKAWAWKVGDGDIFIYNNVPYAERIENGWSKKQAPAGVYRVALVEFTQFMQKEIEKMKTIDYYGGGGEQ